MTVGSDRCGKDGGRGGRNGGNPDFSVRESNATIRLGARCFRTVRRGRSPEPRPARRDSENFRAARHGGEPIWGRGIMPPALTDECRGPEPFGAAGPDRNRVRCPDPYAGVEGWWLTAAGYSPGISLCVSESAMRNAVVASTLPGNSVSTFS